MFHMPPVGAARARRAEQRPRRYAPRHGAPHRNEEHDAETNATTIRVHYSPPGQGTHRAARPQEDEECRPHRLRQADPSGVGPSSRSTNDTPAQAQAQAPRIRHRALLWRQLGPRDREHRARKGNPTASPGGRQPPPSEAPWSNKHKHKDHNLNQHRNIQPTYITPHHSPRMPVNQINNPDAARTEGALWEPAPARPLATRNA
ncbi:hypothetical protein T492DRAFT_974012 [Pavlovales sp. CCMP2436]|nr:hypothetical protein T492DRAFT_974012 [Pavlovales sp. CCMP2436]